MFEFMKWFKKPQKLEDDGIQWITSRCSEDGCNEVGMFPTSDPLEALNRKHFCLEHNKRIAFCMGMG